VAVKYYTLAQLKELALEGARIFGLSTGTYSITDAEKAYDYAVARCGFENPLQSDDDYLKKQHWLLEMMNLYFWRDVHKRSLLKPDVGDAKLGQIFRGARDAIKDIEAAFEKSRAAEDTAHIFVEATDHFGVTVRGSGITEDAIGQNIDPEIVSGS
jgi:hypothetical protein